MSFLPAETSVPLSDHTVGSLLAWRADSDPDALAIVGTRHDGGSVRLSYAEYYDEAQRVATAIAKLAGPGSHVALWAPNVVEWPLIEIGAALAGVTLVALNPVLRAPELRYALTHSRAEVLIHADRSRAYDLSAVVAEVASGFPHLRTVSLADREAWRAGHIAAAAIAAAPANPDLPVMLQYTSGTTGTPKGVLLRHRSLVNVAKLTMEAAGAGSGRVLLNPLPMFHTAACVVGCLGPIWCGGTHVLVEQFAPGPVLEQIRAEGVDVLFYVPAILGALLEEQRGSPLPAPPVGAMLGGAANVPASMIEAAEQVFGASVINLYGQTELSPVLTATRPDDGREDQLRTVGRPLPQVDVKVVDPVSGAVVPIGVSGEVCARGYQQLIEYYRDPGATRRAVDDEGFVHTGDLGRLDTRGYLTLTGRLKELIIRGGENIAPAEIESCLVTHPRVLEAIVFGLPDERLGEIVGCVLRLRGDRPPGLLEDLLGHVRERLAPFKIPARWFAADDVPRTPTGKVQKFRLSGLVESGAFDELR